MAPAKITELSDLPSGSMGICNDGSRKSRSTPDGLTVPTAETYTQHRLLVVQAARLSMAACGETSSFLLMQPYSWPLCRKAFAGCRRQTALMRQFKRRGEACLCGKPYATACRRGVVQMRVLSAHPLYQGCYVAYVCATSYPSTLCVST